MKKGILPYAILLLCFVGCNGLPKKPTFNCIQPPPDSVNINKSLYTEAAAKLEELKIDANLKVGYTNALNIYFQPINDRNAAYALFLNAIDCYMIRASQNKDLLPLVERIVPDLVKILEQKWTGTQGGALVMTDRKAQMLQGSPFKTRIEAYRSREWFVKVLNE